VFEIGGYLCVLIRRHRGHVAMREIRAIIDECHDGWWQLDVTTQLNRATRDAEARGFSPLT
jgi:hypothetical protein